MIALDVDGVLWPQRSPDYSEWLLKLADRAELAWATMWQHDANWQLAPLLGLPHLAVIEFTSFDKLTAVAKWAGNRPLAWIEDWFSRDTVAWAESRNLLHNVPTLLVRVEPTVGLEQGHCGEVSAWLDSLTAPQRPTAVPPSPL